MWKTIIGLRHSTEQLQTVVTITSRRIGQVQRMSGEVGISVQKDTELCRWRPQMHCFSFSRYLVDGHMSDTYCHYLHFAFLAFLTSINNQWFLLPLNSCVVRSPALKFFSLQIGRNLIFCILTPKSKQSIYYFIQQLLTGFKEQRCSADLNSSLSVIEDRRRYSGVINHMTDEHTHG